MKGLLSKSGEIANELFQIGSDKKEYRAYAYRALSTYFFYIGNLKEAYKFASVQGLKYANLKNGRERAKYDINEPYISCLGYRALILRLMNKRKQSLIELSKMADVANKINHPHTSIVATFISVMIWQFEGNKSKTKKGSENLINLCILHGVRLWKIAGEILYNWADTKKNSIRQLEIAIEDWTETGAVLFMPYWKGLLADKYLDEKKNPKEALFVVDQIINYTESWWQAELWRIKALAYFD